MNVHVAHFRAYPRYPEDNEILGVFTTEDLAEDEISRRMAEDRRKNPEYPSRYEQHRRNYAIEIFPVVGLVDDVCGDE